MNDHRTKENSKFLTKIAFSAFSQGNQTIIDTSQGHRALTNQGTKMARDSTTVMKPSQGREGRDITEVTEVPKGRRGVIVRLMDENYIKGGLEANSLATEIVRYFIG